MEYVITSICVLILASVCIVILLRHKKSVNGSVNQETTIDRSLNPTLPSLQKQNTPIQIDILPAEIFPEEYNLVEITDNNVLAHVNQLIPGFAQAGNALNTAVQAARSNGEVLYRAILPAGTKLSSSRTLNGAVKGIYHGTNGIKGHADWIPVKAKNSAAVIANAASAAMSVSSMIVGQYYMTQINTELGKISDGVSQISSFQNNEYRSKVLSLISHAKEIADFQTEILQNSELRTSKILQLDRLKENCTQLLEQANLTLVDFTKKVNLSYDEYENELSEAQNWYAYQNSLLEVLCKISDLKYTLHLGAETRKQCAALLLTYARRTAEVQSRLTEWHQDTVQRLNINIEEMRRKRMGFDGALHFIPGLINDNWNFKTIPAQTINMIEEQASGYRNEYRQDTTDFYARDVQLVSKNGKIYYLPEMNQSHSLPMRYLLEGKKGDL